MRYRFVVLGCGAALAGLLAACENGPNGPTDPSTPVANAPSPPSTPPPAPAPSPSLSPANHAPRLVANVSPDGGAAPLEVRFNLCQSGDEDGDVLSYDIQFGDGERSRRCQERHTYAQAGRYDAYVAVTDGRGGIDDRTVQINVQPAPSGPKPYKIGAVGYFTWSNEIDVAGLRAAVRLNEGSEFFPARGYSHGVGDARGGENVVSARVIEAAGREGVWRFDLGQNSAFVPGSIRGVSGRVEEVTASAITFRLSGRPGEAIAFQFRASR